MDHKRYNVAIIPPSFVARQAVLLSSQLRALGTHFTLNDTSFFPHISLYHVSLSDDVLPLAIRRLGETLKTVHPFPVQQETYYPDHGVWVGVRYRREKPLFDLQSVVIAAIRDLRVIEQNQRYAAEWPELTADEYKQIEYCGWPSAYTRYSPHLTFTKLQKPRSGVIEMFPVLDFSFIVHRIGLFEIGKQGTCVRLFSTWMLRDGI